ncbi:MAG: NADH-quinone oxidoreductase subunit NuoK [bacterium]
MLNHYIVLAVSLFGIGLLGVLLRRNMVIILLCVELMLNSLNLIFVAGSQYLSLAAGRLYVFFVLTVSAAEVAVGLVLVMTLFKTYDTIDINDLSEMKW